MAENGRKISLLGAICIALILSLGLVISSFVVINGVIRIKGDQNVIAVTGSAKKDLKSDFVVWRGSFSTQAKQLPEAYKALKTSYEKVKAFLKSKGIAENDLNFTSITTITNYILLQNGQATSQIDNYRLMQDVEIKSTDVDRITSIYREATELINDGVEFQSYPPQYFYTKIADLKVDMLAKATMDAKNRAEQIASSTGAKIGKLRSAKMGVFQITRQYSTDVSDYGINDTSSIDKEITAVVTCEFDMK